MPAGMILPLHRLVVALACATLLAQSGVAAELVPEELTFDSGGRAVTVTRYAAATAALRPAVLMLHGSSGLEINPQSYAHHARALAASGIDAYLVPYFRPGSNWYCSCWDEWAITVADATTAILRRPDASGRIGLLGFSLGGALAFVSARDPRVTALVVFYGFIPNDEQRLRTTRLPPLLALHGDSDDNVPLLSGQNLVSLARQLGGRAELVVYPGEKHRHSTWAEPAATDAFNREVAFFRAELIGP
ncbi:MAG: dienelactone hydrolase family protein [Proteobacteria bacterium]|nr:dienelactone hydrolase family protein [Pseudomonadota bacterium]MBI3497089.1 dienelactone hydrolase family protein [Pseudomonadota bacterium]